MTEEGNVRVSVGEMEGQVEQRLCGKWRESCGLYSHNLREVFTWHLVKTVVMGQVLSLLICGTAVSCEYLANAGVQTPMLQSFLNYALLLLVYTTILTTRKGERNIIQILKTKWWKYLVMGLADVEANYAVVRAYQFTTLTSIQLLDCFVIPVLMLLSWFILKTRYRLIHFVAVIVCVLGVGAMVGADILAGRDRGSTSDVLLGDGLVLLSAVLYAVSNTCQEYTVKNLSRVEFLGMMGLFGTLISGVQLAVLETQAVAAIKWDLHISMLFAVYVLCMYTLYSFMPVVVKMTSATAVNLSLLTADLFSLFCGFFLFQYTFSALYIISFVVITVGFIMFNIVPTYTAPPEGRPADPTENSSDRLLAPDRDTQTTETSAGLRKQRKNNMPKAKQSSKRKKFDYNKNRKKLKKKFIKKCNPRIEDSQIRNAWDDRKSMARNLQEMGLAFDPNKSLPIKKQKLLGGDSETIAPVATVTKPYVLNHLEEEASQPEKDRKTLSSDLIEYVQYMIREHNEDYKAMARDEKNYYQDTPKQIKRKISEYKRVHPQHYDAFIGSLARPQPMEQ
ncbi:hypothetical protein INR49_027708 [Caranx melampygus]|nr:hypothetical protein INR49_027708 [Caranx melampygus]